MAYDQEILRNLLIEYLHSKKEAKEFFENRLNDDKLLNELLRLVDQDYSGDVRMGAAYWISQFNIELLKKVEDSLLRSQEDELDSVACPIMVALGRIKSMAGLKYLIEKRILPESYWEAIALKHHLDIE